MGIAGFVFVVATSTVGPVPVVCIIDVTATGRHIICNVALLVRATTPNACRELVSLYQVVSCLNTR